MNKEIHLHSWTGGPLPTFAMFVYQTSWQLALKKGQMKSPSWSSISPSQVLRKMDCPYQYVISPARGSAITNKESPNLVVGDKNLPILKICTKRN